MPRFEKPASEYIEKLVYLNRVSKTVKGGRVAKFSALVVVGDGNGRVGVGMGKSAEVPTAIKKGVEDAKKNMFTVPVTAEGSVPHEIMGEYGAYQASMLDGGSSSVMVYKGREITSPTTLSQNEEGRTLPDAFLVK